MWSLGPEVSLGGVRLSPLGTLATVGLLYQPQMIDDGYGAVGGMRIGRGNRITRRKPAPVPLCSPQIPHDLTWDRTQAAAVGSQRLTAWAMARPGPEVSWTCRYSVYLVVGQIPHPSLYLGPWHWSDQVEKFRFSAALSIHVTFCPCQQSLLGLRFF
jgi:hypothetical protein